MTQEPKNWRIRYENIDEAWPSENLVRIFKGSYPNLNLSKNNFSGKRVLDVGCGDVGNLRLCHSLGMELFGVEIEQGIVDIVVDKLRKRAIQASIAVGKNDLLPYQNDFFDYLISWNAIYYMGNSRDFSANILEFYRVLKPGAILIMSIPKHTHEIFKECKKLSEEYVEIKKDRLGIREGVVFRRFKSTSEIKKVFSGHFEEFSFASIEDDYFGVSGHWHLVVCSKV